MKAALDLLRKLRQPEDGELYIVGGYLRDHLLGRDSSDLDVACAGPAAPLAKRAAKLFKGNPVLLDAEHQVWRVILPKGPIAHVDIARFEGGTLEADLKRRDFTVNAMAYGDSWVDPHGGKKDLKKKLLRITTDTSFTADGLRLLRAFRFAAELGFKLEAGTRTAVARDKERVRDAAGERVRHELLRLFSAKGGGDLVREMDQLGLLTALLPELEPMRKCAKVYYGEGGVMEHSLRVLERLELLLHSLKKRYPTHAAGLAKLIAKRSSPGSDYLALLKVTALLHDIAKPATAKPIDGRLRFFGHEEKGGEMADKVLERLRFSKDERRASALMIRHHLRPGNLAANPRVSDKAVYRFFQDLGSDGIGLLLVCWADYTSYLTDAEMARVLKNRNGKLPEPLLKTWRHLKVVALLMNAWFKRKDTVEPPILVDGNDIMKALGIPPGPEVGRALARVREAQAEGKLKTRLQVLSFLKKTK